MKPSDPSARLCPRCGELIPPDAPGGVCLRCGFDLGGDQAQYDGGAAADLSDLAIQSSAPSLPDIGEYELLETIGCGGMGVVYKARRRGWKQIVALKTLVGGLQADEDFKRRFRREARLASKLNHPNIVAVVDVGEHELQPYFCMEYVPGSNLAQRTANQPLRPEAAARYVEAVARAVHYAHEQGILHRDLKPSNILVDADDCPKITDFGLARQMDAGSNLTLSGVMLGTPGYMPPEQLSAGSGEIDPTSDVYGLGAVLYHLLTGRPPYLSSTVADTLKQLQQIEPVPPRNLNIAVSPALQSICLRCLRKKQRQRYQTALAVAEDLERYLQHQPIKANFASGWTASSEDEAVAESVSHRGLWWLLLLIGLAALAGTVWWKQAPPPPKVDKNNPPPPQLKKTPDGTNPPTSQPSPQPFASPDTDAFGWLRLNLFKYPTSGWIRCEIEDANRQTLKTNLASHEAIFKMPVGGYSVKLFHPDVLSWELLGPPVEIHSNETNQLNFSFMYAALKVESDPPGASVTWPAWANRTSPTEVTPFELRFRSGAIPFTAHLRHYFDKCCTNYFYPASEKENQEPFKIRLTAKPVPLEWKPWTNSLGMVFLWVEPLQMWACEIETRVSDYRVFAGDKDSRFDPSIGMLSLTSKGWQQRDYSWDHPGPDFSPNEDCPAVGVSWADATNFCGWLTRREHNAGHLDSGQGYRLPTTNEWFALAGGRRFPWGDEATPKGNYSGAEVRGANWPAPWPVLTNHLDAYPRTAPVYAPEFATNELGFYHLGGNAAEWCQEQVLCGGSWFDGESEDLDHLQTTNLVEPDAPKVRRASNGFRVFLEDVPRSTPD